jgi:hypothetical protein
MKFEIASDDLGIWDVSDVQDLYSSLKSSAKSYNVVLQYDGEDGFNYAFTAVGDGDDLLALYDNAIRWYTKMSAEDAASESAENGGITMAAKKTAADDFDWSLESYDDPDYGEIKEWTYDTGKDEFTIQSYVDEDGIEHFDATSSVNGLLNENFDGFDSFEDAENACYNAADLDDEREADDPFATEASAKKASDQLKYECDEREADMTTNANKQASTSKASEGWIDTGVEPYGSEYDDYSNGYAAVVQLNGSEYKDYGNGYAAIVRLFKANGDDYNVSFEVVDAETGETVYFDADSDYYTFSEAKRAADAWVSQNVTASKHQASVKKADLDGWKKVSLGASRHNYLNGYYAYAWDGSTGDTPGFQLWQKGLRLLHEQGNMTGTLEEIEAAADAWFEANRISLMTRRGSRHAHKKASVKQAHDVSNLDAAISALSDQLALDPDNELADMLADLVEYRNSEAEETAEDEIEAHGENVPITESAKKADDEVFVEPVMVYATKADGDDIYNASYEFKCTACGATNLRPFVVINAGLHCDNCGKKFYCDEVHWVSEDHFSQLVAE